MRADQCNGSYFANLGVSLDAVLESQIRHYQRTDLTVSCTRRLNALHVTFHRLPGLKGASDKQSWIVKEVSRKRIEIYWYSQIPA
jgi:hypothetical protein